MIKSNVNCYKFSTNPNQLWVTGCDKANPYILLKARFETHVLLFICHNQTSTYYLLMSIARIAYATPPLITFS